MKWPWERSEDLSELNTILANNRAKIENLQLQRDHAATWAEKWINAVRAAQKGCNRLHAHNVTLKQRVANAEEIMRNLLEAGDKHALGIEQARNFLNPPRRPRPPMLGAGEQPQVH